MFLKSIVLNGFKSFALRRELLIQDGITGIVGPNGSGKSNIADAMRWVLGEQSSRNLRGASMQEVIFKGTQTRPPKSSCEVSLLFDNTDHHFDVAYSEVCVQRRMYRSGESEFSINGTNCRMKDVIALFRGTGMGKDGYSIIGQGRINRILDSRAAERRVVFEEAAGIMKYRVRKEEAERNLVRTNDNVTRIDDIIGELSAQVTPLEQQVSDTREYLSLSEELRVLDVNLMLHAMQQASDRRAKLQSQLEARKQELESASAEHEEAEKKRSETKERLRVLREQSESLRERLQKTEREKEQSRSERKLAQQKKESAAASLKEMGKRIARAQEKASEHTEAAASLLPEVQELEEKTARAADDLEVFRRQFVPESQSDEKEKAQAAVTDLDRALLEVTNASFDAKLQAGIARTEYERLSAECASSREQLAAARQEEKILKEEGARCADLVREWDEKAASFQDRVVKLKEKRSRADEALLEVDRQISSGTAKAALIEEMQSGYEGYYESVRSLMKTTAGTRISKEVLGTVGDCIEVEGRFETAVETALGNAVQNVIVRDDAAAKELIGILRSQRLGRVTFLPVQDLHVRTLSESERHCLHAPGILGVASELVRFDSQVRAAVEYLLGRTVIAENLDAALELKRQGKNTFRLVTLQGDVVVSGGAITGGSMKRPQVSLLARRRMAEELKGRLRELHRKKEELDGRRKEIIEETQRLEEELAVARDQGREAREKLASAAGAASQGTSRTSSLMHRLHSMEDSMRQTAGNLETLESAQEERQAQIQQLEEKLEHARNEFKRIEREESERELRDASRMAEAARMEANLAELRADLSVRRSEHARHDAAARECIQEAEALKASASELEKEVLGSDAGLGRFEQEEEKASRTLEALSGELESVQRSVKREEENLDFHEQQISGSQDRQTEQSRELYKLEADIDRCTAAITLQSDRLWSEYELTLANAQKLQRDAFAPKAASSRVREIRERLRELGPINPNAVEEYNRIKERLDSLDAQRDDLVKAADDLEVVIAEIMKGMRTAFEEKFAAINDAFSRTFEALFGGGSACIELESDEPVMEAGVEIKAEPPGKKLQNITLLSDGEKAMTAIALCFAMLEVNPSPICLLDEIDAPLDDKNVVRLSEYLKKLRTQLQFIVITHKQTTMDACDTLYGVAMHEKGVSDLVSVDISGKDN